MKNNTTNKNKTKNVYQFKITLKEIKQPIWRKIIVPETYSFWDLHVAIQNAMGWTDTHLHEFEINFPGNKLKVSIGIPDKDKPEVEQEIVLGWKVKIKKFFTLENNTANYIYDYGDYWQHKVQLEKIMPAEKGITYPICIAGKRACPPEDCGGSFGYEEIVNGTNEFQEEYGDYDPEYFNPGDISFDNPAERLKFIM